MSAPEYDHRQRIFHPLLFHLGVHPGEPIKRPLHRAEQRGEKGLPIVEHVRHECADRIGGGQDKRERQADLEPSG
jgi:hypothetical protein